MTCYLFWVRTVRFSSLHVTWFCLLCSTLLWYFVSPGHSSSEERQRLRGFCSRGNRFFLSLPFPFHLSHHRFLLSILCKDARERLLAVYFQPVGLSLDVDYLLVYLSLSCSQYCRCLSMKQPLHFSQEDMPGIRKRIYKELCDFHLSDWLTPHQMACLTEKRLRKLFGIPGSAESLSSCLAGRQIDSSAVPPTSSVRSCCKADFHLQFCKELLTWPSTDPQQMLDPHTLTSMFQISPRWPKDTELCWFLLLHAGIVPAWTQGTALWVPVWVALTLVWPF